MAAQRELVRRAASHGSEGCLGKGCAGDGDAGDNSVIIAATGDASRPDHGRAENTVAGGVGKGSAVAEAVSEVAAFESRNGRGAGAAAKEAEAVAAKLVGVI